MDTRKHNAETTHSRKSIDRWLEESISHAFAWMATTIYQMTGDWRGWRPVLTRTSAHVAVIAVAIIAIGLSKVEWPAQAAPTMSLPALPTSASKDLDERGSQKLPQAEREGDILAVSAAPRDTIIRQPQSHTVIPDRPRLDVITYSVETGDTVQTIASQFGLEPTTIMWANPAVEDVPDLLRIGQELVILPIDGVYHTVGEGDTLKSIAEKYEVEPEAIINCKYNDIEGPEYAIEEGEKVIVPGGEKPYEPKVVTAYAGSVPEGARGTGRFQWPVLGRITQGYWYGHRAIDIGAPTGSAVQATDGGFVSFAGWTDIGYGYLIVIDHANGFATYYAHLSNIYVFEGQTIQRGEVIGAVGNTGNSTGPHLHFEIRRQSVQANPRAYLP